MSLKRLTFPFTGGTKEESTPDYYVLGDDHVGETVASRLQFDGHAVVLVGESAEPPDLSNVHGDPTDVSTLEDASVSEASTVVVATQSDERNLLAAQLVRARFDVARPVVVVNDPDRIESFAAAGHEPICATTAIADAVGDAV